MDYHLKEVKVCYMNTIRKLQIDFSPPTWTEFIGRIRERFEIPLTDVIWLTYEDEDKDMITVSCSEELFQLWVDIQRPVLEKNLSIHPHGVLPRMRPDWQVDNNSRKTPIIHVLIKTPHPSQQKSKQNQVQLDDKKISKSPDTLLAHSSPDSPKHLGPETRGSTSLPDSLFPDPPEQLAGEPLPSTPAHQPTGDLSRMMASVMTCAVQAISPDLIRSLGGYAQSLTEATDRLNEACKVVSDRLQPRSVSSSNVHPSFTNDPPPGSGTAVRGSSQAHLGLDKDPPVPVNFSETGANAIAASESAKLGDRTPEIPWGENNRTEHLQDYNISNRLLTRDHYQRINNCDSTTNPGFAASKEFWDWLNNSIKVQEK